MIDGENVAGMRKNLALAELRFLRALAHYDLMRLFGPVPIRDRAVGNDEESLNPPEIPLKKCWMIVNDDLDFAIATFLH
jgi:starch-binding outer membrane protein, SusD/RagB family